MSVFLKGDIELWFSAPAAADLHGRNTSFFDLQVQKAEASEVQVSEEYRVSKLLFDQNLHFPELKDVLLNQGGNKFREDLVDLVVLYPEIQYSGNEGGTLFGKIRGQFYARLLPPPPPPVAAGVSGTAETPEFVNPNPSPITTQEYSPMQVPEPQPPAGGSSWPSWIFSLLALLGLFGFFGVNAFTLFLGAGILLNLFKGFFRPQRTFAPATVPQIPSSNGFGWNWLWIFLLLVCIWLAWKGQWSLVALWLGILALVFIFSLASPVLRFLRGLFKILFVLFLLGALLVMFGKLDWGGGAGAQDAGDDKDERSEFLPDSSGRKVSGADVQHFRRWKDYAGNEYEMRFRLPAPAFKTSRQNRNSISREDFAEIYANLNRHDSPLIPSLMQGLDSIRIARNPDSRAFAEIVVSFVQDIPYVLVHPYSCQYLLDHSDQTFIHEYHSAGKPCLADIKFGLQAPAEFAYNLAGDCDTRTVLCFTLLEKFGYKPVVMISESYGHSILGIDLPAPGQFKEYKGVKYRIWETTAKDFRIGQLPPEVGDMNYWEVALSTQ